MQGGVNIARRQCCPTHPLPKEASAQWSCPPPTPPIPLTFSCSRPGTQLPGGPVPWSPASSALARFPLQAQTSGGFVRNRPGGARRSVLTTSVSGQVRHRCVSTPVNDSSGEKNFHQRPVDFTGAVHTAIVSETEERRCFRPPCPPTPTIRSPLLEGCSRGTRSETGGTVVGRCKQRKPGKLGF